MSLRPWSPHPQSSAPRPSHKKNHVNPAVWLGLPGAVGLAGAEGTAPSVGRGAGVGAQSLEALRVLAWVHTSRYAVCLDLLQRGLALAIPPVQKEQLGSPGPQRPAGPSACNNHGKMRDGV